MLKLLVTSISICFVSLKFSQNATAQTSGVSRVQLPTANQGNILASAFEGQRFKIKSDDGIEGNPLLFEDWKSGEVTLNNNEKYNIEKVNLDASNNKFIYYKNDTMYEFFDNIKEIKIYNENHFTDPSSDMVFRSDLKLLTPAFVQVLADGKITIIREYIKKPKGENYSNGIVNNTRKYFLQSTQSAIADNKIIPLIFNSASLEQLTLNRRKEMITYLKENKLNPKKEKDFLMTINYFNSISKLCN